ncbi:MAG: GNAT family N-acetyltransferase [Actinomycetota bacterium]|nr:GNAT family N-acetyltransferase [Actinomycetota bacterium]
MRAAVVDDLAAVLRLLAEDVIREREEPVEVTRRQRDALVELVADPRETLLAGEEDGELVATAQVSWLRHLIYDGGLVAQVESVRVRSDLRGQGLGERLMADVEWRARERGCARLQLTTNAARTDAQRFYERLGFRASHVGMKRWLEES